MILYLIVSWPGPPKQLILYLIVSWTWPPKPGLSWSQAGRLGRRSIARRAGLGTGFTRLNQLAEVPRPARLNNEFTVRVSKAHRRVGHRREALLDIL